MTSAQRAALVTSTAILSATVGGALSVWAAEGPIRITVPYTTTRTITTVHNRSVATPPRTLVQDGRTVTVGAEPQLVPADSDSAGDRGRSDASGGSSRAVKLVTTPGTTSIVTAVETTTTTLPAETVVETVTETLPAETVTVTTPAPTEAATEDNGGEGPG